MLRFKISSKKFAVAEIDYSELEIMQRGKLLQHEDILGIIEKGCACVIPTYDVCEMDGKNKIITLWAYENHVECSDY